MTLLLLYSIILSTYRAPDEPLHADLSHGMSEDFHYPAWDEGQTSAGIRRSLPLVRFSRRSAHLAADEAPHKPDRPSLEELEAGSEPSGINQLTQHPPQYYMAAGSTVQHTGVIFDEVGPGHIYRKFPGDHGGYFNMLKVPNNFQAVTGACLMSKRSVLEAVSGLSTLLLNFNDIDYCLKIRQHGLRVALDPDTTLFHFKSSSRLAEVSEWEVMLLQDRHAGAGPDPYYNPRFLRTSLNYVAPLVLADGSTLR